MSKTILMIHGFGAAGESWASAAARFKAAGYAVEHPTIHAALRTVGPPPAGLAGKTLADYVAEMSDLAKSIAKRDGEKPVVFGHSMGGLIAQKLAEAGLASGIVLFAPASPADARGKTSLSSVFTFLNIAATSKPETKAVKIWKTGFKWGVLNQTPAARHDAIFATTVHDSGRALSDLAYPDRDPNKTVHVDAAKVTAPVLVLTGARDRTTPIADVRLVAGKYAGSTLKEYPNNAHWLIDEPGSAEILAEVQTWLDEKGLGAKAPTVKTETAAKPAPAAKTEPAAAPPAAAPTPVKAKTPAKAATPKPADRQTGREGHRRQGQAPGQARRAGGDHARTEGSQDRSQGRPAEGRQARARREIDGQAQGRSQACRRQGAGQDRRAQAGGRDAGGHAESRSRAEGDKGRSRREVAGQGQACHRQGASQDRHAQAGGRDAGGDAESRSRAEDDKGRPRREVAGQGQACRHQSSCQGRRSKGRSRAEGRQGRVDAKTAGQAQGPGQNRRAEAGGREALRQGRPARPGAGREGGQAEGRAQVRRGQGSRHCQGGGRENRRDEVDRQIFAITEEERIGLEARRSGRRTGEGRMATPVIMVHGAFCGGWTFDAFRRPFEAAGHVVQTPDLLGHGDGALVAGRSMVDYAKQIAALCEACDEPPILIGHSMGGLVAQMAAARASVSRLILLAPSPPWGVTGSSLEEAASAVSLYALGPYWLQAVAPDYGVVESYTLDRLPRAERKRLYAKMNAESGRALWETLNWFMDPFMTTGASPGGRADPGDRRRQGRDPSAGHRAPDRRAAGRILRGLPVDEPLAAGRAGLGGGRRDLPGLHRRREPRGGLNPP
jgi:pimeloyl-ACP methyl ester carboxylesterase